MIDSELRDIITPELAKGEELLWAGRPQKHPNLMGGLWVFLFSLFWTGMVFVFFLFILLSWLFQNELSGDDMSGSMVIWMGFVLSIFLFVGLGGLFHGARFLFGAKKYIFALTNRRGLIIDRFMRTRTLSIGIGALSIMQRDDHKNYSTFYFGPITHSYYGSNWSRSFEPFKLSSIFYNVHNPDQIEALILEHFQFRGAS